jgi:leucyl-tRNA synthetase
MENKIMNEITKIARNLRNNQTKAEKLLWYYLKDKKTGFKFRRQYPITYKIDNISMFFVADFACTEKKFIIEVDGKIHEKQIVSDEIRESIIRSMGYTVIRFDNDDVMENTGKVLADIMKHFV